jgi:superfamily II DNA/RNA helicase
MTQGQRERALSRFRDGKATVLVATNVAARGLDVRHVGMVINYELPESADLLTHRIGRTGRAGADGIAVTLITPADEKKWKRLRNDGAPELRRVATWTDAERQAALTAPARAGGSGSRGGFRGRSNGARPGARGPRRGA